jgi:hypothetical protein
MTPRRTTIRKLLGALILAVAFGGVAAAPALADGWHGHQRFEHRGHGGHEWHGHAWRGHDGWRYYHPYRYGYAYPGYYGYYAPPPVYAPPSVTLVVPFR